jgi:acyl carrier protein
MSNRTEVELQLAELIVSALNLELPAESIDVEAPLYGEGLGLDSIDMLEISLAISKRYSVQLHADDPDNAKVFASLRSLARHVQSEVALQPSSGGDIASGRGAA